jgi:monothiol glutaredoxin
MNQETLTKIKSQIDANPIILYIKGTVENPQCGFSSKAIRALQACKAEFVTVDVLANPDIRAALPHYSNWPTFPQLYIKGELIGGCDIIMELLESGELQTLISGEKV